MRRAGSHGEWEGARFEQIGLRGGYRKGGVTRPHPFSNSSIRRLLTDRDVGGARTQGPSVGKESLLDTA